MFLRAAAACERLERSRARYRTGYFGAFLARRPRESSGDRAVSLAPGFDSQRLFHIEDHGRELGFVVVDSTVCGRARGGLRLAEGLTEQELRAAARAMTLKYGLLGLPQGGAKAGLHGDPDGPIEARRAELLAFGRRIAPLLGAHIYVPDADMGTKADDIRWMMQTLDLPAGRYDWRANHSGDYTAVSCVAAGRARLASQGRTLTGARVAIEGFGGVGAAAAHFLPEPARVSSPSRRRAARSMTPTASMWTSCGPRRSRTAAVSSRTIRPRRRLARDRLLELGRGSAVSLRAFVQRARGERGEHSGARHLIGREQSSDARSGGRAPRPWRRGDSGLRQQLRRRTRRHARIRGRDAGTDCGARRRVRQRGPCADCSRAAGHAVTLRVTAEALARARHAAVREAAEHPEAAGRLLGAGLALYRRGWIPPWLMAPLAARSILSSAVRVAARS